MKRRRVSRLLILLIASMVANGVLVVGVLYLRVPAVHDALHPALRAFRGLPPLEALEGIEPSTLGPNQIRLLVSDDKSEVLVHLAAPDGGTVYVVSFDTGRELRLGEGEASFSWALHDGGSRSEPNEARVHLVRQGEPTGPMGEIEIFRVSEEEGVNRLDAHRENGWLFFGRCTFDLVGEEAVSHLISEETATLHALTYDERERIRESYPQAVQDRPVHESQDTLIDDLSGLLEFLCESGFRNVSASNNAAIYAERPFEALSGVCAGDIGVVCQGFRSVFVWVALSGGWLDVHSLREVDLFRFSTTTGIDTNSHAVVEVRAGSGPWVLFDPLSQAVFTDSSGRYLSTEDVRYLRGADRLDEIEVVSLGAFCVSGTVPYYAEEDGGFWEGQDFEDRDPFNYNYWSHFQRIVYRNLTLPVE